MKQSFLFVLAFVFVLAFLVTPAGNCLAAEAEKNKQIDSLTSIQLGDYSLKFDAENPRKSTDLDDPPGLKSLKKDAFSPFLGLRFSAPLKDAFFKPCH